MFGVSIPNDGEKRYSPSVCLGCESHTVTGNPDPKHINTPAMAAGVTDRLWDVSDLVAAWEVEELVERAA